jgi:predicted DNA-binding helix-hairpin-helix protein
MLKVLLHGSCSYDCAYCSVRLNRCDLSFSPEELAHTFLTLYRQNLVSGLFLSSGIPNDVDLVMEEIIETGRLVRRAGFDGYLHLKILPGAARADINEAARLATCISINIETTSADRLRALSGVKDYLNDIMKRLEWVADAQAGGHHTTQLVVGAAGETDAEILACVTGLYKTLRPSRIYYSAFQSLPRTRLAGTTSTPPWRSRRWYQMDFLIRKYGFSGQELETVMSGTGFLPNEDPKALLACNREPVDPNTASFEELIRIPGVGPVTARAIIGEREHHRLRNLGDLALLGTNRRKAGPYLSFPGRPEKQASLASFTAA